MATPAAPLDGPPEPQRVDVHADDASRLLAEIADGPASVFGNSSGAQIGLEQRRSRQGWTGRSRHPDRAVHSMIPGHAVVLRERTRGRMQIQ